METNVVNQLGEGMANALGNTLHDGLDAAFSTIDGNSFISDAQSSLASILLLFVGMAALFYVGRWLYKAFKRGAA